jgi:hypothetical protein
MDEKVSNPSANLAQLREQIASALSSADSQAAQSAQNLQLVLQARVSRLSRTAEALKQEQGGDDPGAKQAEAEAAAAKAAAGKASMLARQFSTPAPQVSQNGWALHGRVFDAESQPVSGFTVFFVDAEKAFQQAYGFAYTDKTGYFLINYAGMQTSEQSAAALPLFIEVADTKSHPVYLSTAPFEPAPGCITYQNIVVASRDEAIGNPPPPVRKVALPGKKR